MFFCKSSSCYKLTRHKKTPCVWFLILHAYDNYNEAAPPGCLPQSYQTFKADFNLTCLTLAQQNVRSHIFAFFPTFKSERSKLNPCAAQMLKTIILKQNLYLSFEIIFEILFALKSFQAKKYIWYNKPGSSLHIVI